ncbi:MAG: phosphoribulokinase [Gammaproteobacteria bacterium]|jgi:phosphoribulokinase
MSSRHPIVAVTGSSGAGTSTVQHAFADIFRRAGIKGAFVHGNSYRRYTPEQVERVFREAAERGNPISHFGPEANHFDRLEGLFREYARSGTGLVREYIETADMAEAYRQPLGTYTPWTELESDTDLLFYEGQHGACIEATWSMRKMSDSHNPVVVKERHKLLTREDVGVDIARWVDLLIGVVPSINLEWIQKIHSDFSGAGRSVEATVMSILHRMPDYVRYITPQFSLTDINFQRIPLVDTSNPFIALDVPRADESMVVIRFREPKKYDFPRILKQFPYAFMSRPNTMVVQGGDMQNALEVICAPLVEKLVDEKRTLQEI